MLFVWFLNLDVGSLVESFVFNKHPHTSTQIWNDRFLLNSFATQNLFLPSWRIGYILDQSQADSFWADTIAYYVMIW